jgi:hypothetical protein
MKTDANLLENNNNTYIINETIIINGSWVSPELQGPGTLLYTVVAFNNTEIRIVVTDENGKHIPYLSTYTVNGVAFLRETLTYINRYTLTLRPIIGGNVTNVTPVTVNLLIMWFHNSVEPYDKVHFGIIIAMCFGVAVLVFIIIIVLITLLCPRKESIVNDNESYGTID